MYKKILISSSFLTTACLISVTCQAQTNIFPGTGNVGIGTPAAITKISSNNPDDKSYGVLGITSPDSVVFIKNYQHLQEIPSVKADEINPEQTNVQLLKKSLR